MPASFFAASLAVRTCVILSFIVGNIQQSKNGFATLEIYQMRSVSTFQQCTIWLPCGLHNKLMLCMTDYWIHDTLQWKKAKSSLDHGDWGHLRPCRERCLESGFGKSEKKSHCLNLIIFHWFIEHPLISIHFEAGPFCIKVFSHSLTLSLSLFSLACSLHFIINWHKPFFEVQEPSWEMTAQQTMNTTQKDNEHC